MKAKKPVWKLKRRTWAIKPVRPPKPSGKIYKRPTNGEEKS